MKTNDIVLTEIARRFVKIDPLPEPDDFSYRTAFDSLDHYANLNPTVCKRYMNARFYFGGRQRVLAVSTIQRAYEVARFADLIVIRFWKYRIRAQIPNDSQTCFSVSRAKEDHEFLKVQRPEIIEMIDELERHFVALGIFHDGGVHAEPKPEKRSSALAVLQKIIANEFSALEQAVNESRAEGLEFLKSLDIQNKKLDTLATKQDEAARRHADTADRLTAIERNVNELLAAVKLVAGRPAGISWLPFPPSSQPIEQKDVPEPIVEPAQAKLPTEPFKAGVGFVAPATTGPASVFSVGNKKQTEA